MAFSEAVVFYTFLVAEPFVNEISLEAKYLKWIEME